MRRFAALITASGALIAWDTAGQTPASAIPPDPNGSDVGSKPDDARDSSPPDEPQIPPAQDTLTGRVTVSVAGALVVPLGSLENELPWRDVAGVGLGADFEPAIGASRSVMIGGWLHASRLGAGGRCDGCTTQNLAGGPMIRFHLVQGLKLDPWVSMGVGLRAINITSDDDFNYVGLDWLRLTAGADWYASPNVAVGPFLQALAGTALQRPDATPVGDRPFDDHSTIYWTFSSGLRLTLGWPGH